MSGSARGTEARAPLSSIEFVAFPGEHLEAAAALLVERVTRQRAAEPLLVPDDPRAALEELLGAERTSGHVALRDGRVEAFVLAGLEDDPIYGTNAWIGPAGYAARAPETLRDLYAVAADGWYRDGYRRHYVDVPAIAAELDPWYRLGFHHMHVDTGMRATERLPVRADGFAIRDVRPEDLDDVVRTDLLIWRHQQTTPSFGLPDMEPDVDERRADWVEELARDGVHMFVAERDGRIIGLGGIGPWGHALAVPFDATDLATTAVDPAERGRGVGLALTHHAITMAAELGHSVIATSWRMTNLLASRFWPARGFRPVYHRLHRAVGIG